MTLVDSLDSVLMLYAYAGPTQDPSISRFALTYDDKKVREDEETVLVPTLSNDPNFPIAGSSVETAPPMEALVSPGGDPEDSRKVLPPTTVPAEEPHVQPTSREERVLASKANTISSLSITLTLLSILVALRCVIFRFCLPVLLVSADSPASH